MTWQLDATALSALLDAREITPLQLPTDIFVRWCPHRHQDDPFARRVRLACRSMRCAMSIKAAFDARFSIPTASAMKRLLAWLDARSSVGLMVTTDAELREMQARGALASDEELARRWP
jgi:hypothetical protein